MVLASIIFFTMPSAQAEILNIVGNNEDRKIFIAIEDNLNIIKVDTKEGYSEHFESKIKQYHTGAFSLKNPESGILLWAHPTNDTQWKIIVLTNAGVERFIGNTIHLNNIQITETTQLDNFIGADISKWDIPTNGRSDYKYVKPEKVWNPNSLDVLFSVPNKVKYKHNLNFDFTAIDTQIHNKNDQRLSDVSMFVTILNPIGDIMGTWNDTTNDFGVFGEKYYIVENQMLGEYKLKVSLDKENYTSISKMVSFFVIPIDNDSSSNKCPYGYFLNSTECVENIK